MNDMTTFRPSQVAEYLASKGLVDDFLRWADEKGYLGD